MKVLFFNGANIAPHLETEMEMALDLIKKGHDVYFVHCKGELETCFLNPEHKHWICANCALRKEKAFKILGIKKNNIIPFPSKALINKQEIPEVFDTMENLRNFTYQGVDIGMGVVSSLVSLVRDHKLDTVKYRNKIYRGIKTSLYAYEAGKLLLDSVVPDEVVIFNGRFLEIRPFMRLCEQRGIRYYTHERGGLMDTYLVRENSTPHSLTATTREIFTIWDGGGKEKEEIGRKFFVDRRNRVTQSWFVFTEKQEMGRLPENFDTGKKNIALFNSSMDEYEGIAGFTNKIYPGDNQGIRALLESFREDDSIHFYLRIHPNLKGLLNTQVMELKEIDREFSNITMIGPEDVIDSYALLEAVDTVCVFNSTIGAEACFWGRPVIVLGHAIYGGLDGFYKPRTHAEAVQLLKQDLKPIGGEDILKYGYWELAKGLKYKYYQPEDLGKGKFLGKKIDANIIRKMINICIH